MVHQKHKWIDQLPSMLLSRLRNWKNIAAEDEVSSWECTLPLVVYDEKVSKQAVL